MQQQTSRRAFLHASAMLASLPVALRLPNLNVPTGSGKPAVPGAGDQSRAYLGVHCPGSPAGCSDPLSLERFIGRRFAINHHFRSPPDTDWSPLRDHLRRDVLAGRIPLLSYAAGKAAGFPNTARGLQEAAFRRLVQTANGERDAYLDGQAAALAALRAPVFFRFTWEFDIRYLGAPGALAFVAAWRRVHDRFAMAGATNVAFVWCPTWRAFGDGKASQFYPGDEYVDWIGADGYARYPQYPSFASLFTAANVFALQRGKPFMVAETGAERLPGSANPSKGTPQSAWLDDLHHILAAGRFENLKALVYFHTDGREHGHGDDWRVTSPPGGPAARAFRTLAWTPRLSAVARPRGFGPENRNW